MELLAFASRQFAPKIVNHSVRFIHSHFVPFLLMNERSGRRKPPAERSALYSIDLFLVYIIPLKVRRGGIRIPQLGTYEYRSFAYWYCGAPIAWYFVFFHGRRILLPVL